MAFDDPHLRYLSPGEAKDAMDVRLLLRLSVDLTWQL